MDTSLKDDALAQHPLLLRVLVVAGALFGFTLLALAMSGTADASEGPPPARPGLLDGVGNTGHDVVKPAGSVLEPVAGVVHVVSSLAAPVVKPVTSGLEPVVTSLTRPVLDVTKPLVSALRPVTSPVLDALSPVISPVLHAAAPVTAPVARAIGADHVVPAVTGQPAKPTPRGDTGSSPVVAEPAGPVVVKQSAASHRPDLRVGSRQAVGHTDSDTAGVAGPMSGSGGIPAGVSGVSGAMSAGSGGQQGGEFAVTDAGAGTPGTDRSWRAPPAGAWSLHWLEFYGNDHPS